MAVLPLSYTSFHKNNDRNLYTFLNQNSMPTIFCNFKRLDDQYAVFILLSHVGLASHDQLSFSGRFSFQVKF